MICHLCTHASPLSLVLCDVTGPVRFPRIRAKEKSVRSAGATYFLRGSFPAGYDSTEARRSPPPLAAAVSHLPCALGVWAKKGRGCAATVILVLASRRISPQRPRRPAARRRPPALWGVMTAAYRGTMRRKSGIGPLPRALLGVLIFSYETGDYHGGVRTWWEWRIPYAGFGHDAATDGSGWQGWGANIYDGWITAVIASPSPYRAYGGYRTFGGSTDRMGSSAPSVATISAPRHRPLPRMRNEAHFKASFCISGAHSAIYFTMLRGVCPFW